MSEDQKQEQEQSMAIKFVIWLIKTFSLGAKILGLLFYLCIIIIILAPFILAMYKVVLWYYTVWNSVFF